MTPLVAACLAVTASIVLVWVVRTASAERRAGRGRGQTVRRTRLTWWLDVLLWVLGVGWFALLAVYFTLSLTGA